MIGLQWLQLLLADLRRVYAIGWVPGDELPLDGLLQGAVQDGVDVADARGGEPVVELGAVETLDLRRREFVELTLTQGGDDVRVQLQPVVVVGAGSNVSLGRVFQPASNVLFHGLILCVNHNPRVAFGHLSGELDSGLVLGTAVHGYTLRLSVGLGDRPRTWSASLPR